jgi:hypothetical protein
MVVGSRTSSLTVCCSTRACGDPTRGWFGRVICALTEGKGRRQGRVHREPPAPSDVVEGGQPPEQAGHGREGTYHRGRLSLDEARGWHRRMHQGVHGAARRSLRPARWELWGGAVGSVGRHDGRPRVARWDAQGGGQSTAPEQLGGPEREKEEVGGGWSRWFWRREGHARLAFLVIATGGFRVTVIVCSV